MRHGRQSYRLPAWGFGRSVGWAAGLAAGPLRPPCYNLFDDVAEPFRAVFHGRPRCRPCCRRRVRHRRHAARQHAVPHRGVRGVQPTPRLAARSRSSVASGWTANATATSSLACSIGRSPPASSRPWPTRKNRSIGASRWDGWPRLAACCGCWTCWTGSVCRSALATSAPLANVEHTLRELDLTTRLSTIARSDTVPRGKPFPDVFLEAARLLGVDAEACLAFEDAPAGIVAARSAGMHCAAIASSYPPEVLAATDPPPHWVVADYDEFLDRTELGARLRAPGLRRELARRLAALSAFRSRCRPAVRFVAGVSTVRGSRRHGPLCACMPGRRSKSSFFPRTRGGAVAGGLTATPPARVLPNEGRDGLAFAAHSRSLSPGVAHEFRAHAPLLERPRHRSRHRQHLRLRARSGHRAQRAVGRRVQHDQQAHRSGGDARPRRCWAGRPAT